MVIDLLRERTHEVMTRRQGANAVDAALVGLRLGDVLRGTRVSENRDLEIRNTDFVFIEDGTRDGPEARQAQPQSDRRVLLH